MSKPNCDINNIRLLVATGASGGHILPAISFIESFKEKSGKSECLLVLPERAKSVPIPLQEFKKKYVSIYPIKSGISIKNIINVLRFFKGIFQSMFIVMEFRPEVVIGFGTIDTVPLLLFAWFFRIKTIIHEQNVIPGRANILLSKFVDKVAISFGETRKYLNNNKILLTGNPIRKEMVYIDKSVAKDFFAFKENAFTILIMGGSQGSYRINRAILDAFDYFGKERASLQIIHISGVEDYNELLSAYNDLRLEVRLFPFLREMEYAYSLADLAICRAGATTISELIYFKLPALLVPYPFARRHQEGNAGLLEKIGAAIVVEDSKLDGKILSEIIEGFLIDSEKARAVRSNYGNLPVEPNKGDPLLRVVLDSQYK